MFKVKSIIITNSQIIKFTYSTLKQLHNYTLKHSNNPTIQSDQPARAQIMCFIVYLKANNNTIYGAS